MSSRKWRVPWAALRLNAREHDGLTSPLTNYSSVATPHRPGVRICDPHLRDRPSGVSTPRTHSDGGADPAGRGRFSYQAVWRGDSCPTERSPLRHRRELWVAVDPRRPRPARSPALWGTLCVAQLG